MAKELAFRDEAAAEYERAFAHVSAHFMPALFDAAGLSAGMRVLDVAAGTGLGAEDALARVGPEGHVTATDVSPAMVERARERLAARPNASVAVEDGQSLSFPSGSFDAVVCSLGLMFFPDPARGVSEFGRMLRSNGRASMSVLTAPDRSYNGRINAVIAKYVSSLAEATERTFSLGDEARLRSLLANAGFSDIRVLTKSHKFKLPSFDAYYGPFERGGGSTGQALLSLPDEVRAAVREAVRKSLRDDGGPVDIDVEFRIASGRR
jgi:ubiquinone/menaquinone biosynthesis C-methylase UbiE